MKVTLEHESGVTKEVKRGFSWTVFFFGLLVPLIRGDLKWAAIMFLLQAIVGFFTIGIGAFVISLVFAFTYNKTYIKGLMEKGYRPTEEFEESVASYINE